MPSYYWKQDNDKWSLYENSNDKYPIASICKCGCTFCNNNICAEIMHPRGFEQNLFKSTEKAKAWVLKVITFLDSKSK